MSFSRVGQMLGTQTLRFRSLVVSQGPAHGDIDLTLQICSPGAFHLSFNIVQRAAATKLSN